MGEMTIRLDEAVLIELRERAERMGTDVDRLVSDLLREGLSIGAGDRAAVARSIMARSRLSGLRSRDAGLEKLRLVRAGGCPVDFDTTASLREDRDRR